MTRGLRNLALYPIPGIDRWGAYIPLIFVALCYSVSQLWIVYPGYSIAALAFAAVIITVRADKFAPAERVIWVFIGAVLMLAEIRVLYLDRQANETQAAVERQEQENKFEATTASLNTAIDGIKKTLEDSQKTLIQTSPKAAITILENNWAVLPKDNKILPGVGYYFNTILVNKGNDPAKITKQMVGIYPGKPDDDATEKELASEFEADWNKKSAATKPLPMFVDIPLTTTTQKTFMSGDLRPVKTIYFLVRVEYSDSSGHWGAEDCEAFQIGPGDPPFLNYQMFHSCRTFRIARYPIAGR